MIEERMTEEMKADPPAPEPDDWLADLDDRAQVEMIGEQTENGLTDEDRELEQPDQNGNDLPEKD